MAYLYLASPYSHKDENVRYDRYHLAMVATASLIRKSLAVFSPIVHCHELALRFELPTDVEFWWDYDEKMLRSAESFAILKIKGWETSVGVKKELAFARQLKLPIGSVKMDEKEVRLDFDL